MATLHDLKNLLGILVVLAFIFCGCNRKNEAAIKSESTTENVDKMDEDRMLDGPQESSPKNSRIIGKVVKVLPNTKADKNLKHCDENPCRALVEVMALPRNGSNYHGQFNESDKIEVQFLFTIEATHQLFPELYKPLVGLTTGDFFEAELFEHEPGQYRVQLYNKKN